LSRAGSARIDNIGQGYPVTRTAFLDEHVPQSTNVPRSTLAGGPSRTVDRHMAIWDVPSGTFTSMLTKWEFLPR
jgi:hypothetical protein